MIETRPLRRGSGPYTIEYGDWDQDRVVLVRLQLDCPSRDDAAAVATAFDTWLSEATFPFEDAPNANNQGIPNLQKANMVRERSHGGCRLTWFSHGDSLTVSVCSGGEDGIDSTYWCCTQIAEVARRAAPATQVSWQEWRGQEFAEVEPMYVRPPSC